jgi:hypothetical protein
MQIPEKWIKSVMAFYEIENLMPWKELAAKTRMYWTFLKGQALSYFGHHLRKRVEAGDSEFPDNDITGLVLRDSGLEYMISIFYVFTHLITDNNCLTVLFTPATNLDDTKQYLIIKQQI